MGDSNELPKITSPDEIRKLYASITGSRNPSVREMLDVVIDLYRPYLYKEVAESSFENHAWKFREAYRVRMKLYAPIYFSAQTKEEQQLLTYMNNKKEHFVHLSKDAPGYIAYTPDDASGVQDRRVKTTVGRYLKKHFELDDAKIRELSDAFRNRYGIEDVMFARTQEEVIEAYTKGPGSCMSYVHDDSGSSKERYGSHVHPAAVYASPDTAVAYLRRGGKINSRAVVFHNPDDPNDKRYVRVYGDDVLRLKLESMGYRMGNLEGAKLRKIVGRRTDNIMLPDTYVMPFLDDQTTGEACIVRVEADHLRVISLNKKGSTYIGARNQGGLIGRYAEYRRVYGARYDVGPNPKKLDSSDSGTELLDKPLSECTCMGCGKSQNLQVSRTLGGHVCETCVSKGNKYRRVYVGVDETDILPITSDTKLIDVIGLNEPVLAEPSILKALKIVRLTRTHYKQAPEVFALQNLTSLSAINQHILSTDGVMDVLGRVYHIDDVYTVGKRYIYKRAYTPDIPGIGVNIVDQSLEFNFDPNPKDLNWKPIRAFFDDLTIRFKPRTRKKAMSATIVNGDMEAIEPLWDNYKQYVAEHHPSLINDVAQGTLVDGKVEAITHA